MEIGRLTLDRNVKNVFSQVEQASFCPSTRVPGIEFSPDKMLQSRLFAYTDAARHRIGANFQLIPVNRPIAPSLTPTQRNGPMNTGDNEEDMPNYYPCSFNPNAQTNPKRYNEVREHLKETDVDRFDSHSEDNYTQVRQLYESFSMEERNRLHGNMAGDLQTCYGFIQKRALGHLEKIHSEYANGVRKALDSLKQTSTMAQKNE